MKKGRGDGGRPAASLEASNARLVAVNEELVLSLVGAQEHAQTSARLLDDMSRSVGPDTLTRLPNRVVLLDRLLQAMAMARLHDSRLAILSVDVGDEPGDTVIQWAAARLRALVGTIETVSRHGPRGFLVLLPEVLFDEATVVADRVLSALDGRRNGDANVPRPEVHVGGALFPDHGRTPLELIASAEAAMRGAVMIGARNLVMFDRSMADGERPAASDAHEWPPPSDESRFTPGASPLQAFVQDANERLLLASVASLEKLERAESVLEQRADFMGVLAHELRTPLTPISLAASMMSEVDPAGIPRLQGVISRQVAHISRLLTDLLELSRLNAGRVRLKREPTSLAAVVSHAIEACAPDIESRRQVLRTALPKASVRVMGDPLRLGQVVVQLLENASRVTPDGGWLDLRVTTTGQRVTIAVADSGKGVSGEALAHIFEPFGQIRGPMAANGLESAIALTLVRALVEAHGGTIQAENQRSRAGTVFTVTLARALDATARR